VLVEQLLDAGVEALVDVGLADAASDLADRTPRLTAASVDSPLGTAALVRTAAALHAGGSWVDWELLLAGRGRHISAPGYVWQHRSHWIEVSAQVAVVPPPQPAAPAPEVPEASVMPLDTSQARSHPVHSPGDVGDQVAAPDRPALVAHLLSLNPGLRHQALLERVLGHVTDVLGEESGDGVDPERGFFELGMDSVMAVALKTRLDDELGVGLPATLTFEFPTARALAGYLLEGLDKYDGAEAAAVVPVPEPEGVSATESIAAGDEDLESLSEDELMERLMAGLATSEQLLGGVD
jgi:acyl transferase domain-containing protein